MNEPEKITITQKVPNNSLLMTTQSGHENLLRKHEQRPPSQSSLCEVAGGEKIVDIDDYNGIMIHYRECKV